MKAWISVSAVKWEGEGQSLEMFLKSKKGCFGDVFNVSIRRESEIKNNTKIFDHVNRG